MTPMLRSNSGEEGEGAVYRMDAKITGKAPNPFAYAEVLEDRSEAVAAGEI